MTNWLNSKNVLAVCMETSAGGRNYSGGLGILYGDTCRTMNRLGASFIAITPIYKYGYVRQTITSNGAIDEFPEQNFEDFYIDTGKRLYIPLQGQTVTVKLWQNKAIPTAYGLDTALPENGVFANINNNLYGENGFGPYNGDEQRLIQEVIVGVGAIMAAKELGYDFDTLHLNEGHGVFSAVYLITEYMKHWHCNFKEAIDKVRSITVFTTHTPIAAGNQSRSIDTIMKLGANFGLSREEIQRIGGDHTGTMFGSTTAALRLAKYANAVAWRHQETSQDLWKHVTGRCPIGYIDNGVDITFWQSPRIKLAYESGSPVALYKAHMHEKDALINFVNERNNIQLDRNKIIIGFARRVVPYKRADLIFQDIARFEQLIAKKGIQIIFAGKTHPKDNPGKEILMRLYQMSLRYPKNVIFLQNYDEEIALALTRGCDLWLGNPEIPKEACSTSGMKAAANGVLNLSTPDGWWYKSCRYGINGWTIGESNSRDPYTDAQYLYKVLEEKVLPTYENPDAWAHMMQSAIHTALTECDTVRMCHDYYHLLYNTVYIPR